MSSAPETIDTPDLRLLVALADLTEVEREAFIDSHLLGHDFEQIARRAGTSRQYVSNAAGRARFKLARLLFPGRNRTPHAPGDGSYAHYRKGCRCEQCRAANTERCAKSTARTGPRGDYQRAYYAANRERLAANQRRYYHAKRISDAVGRSALDESRATHGEGGAV